MNMLLSSQEFSRLEQKSTFLIEFWHKEISLLALRVTQETHSIILTTISNFQINWLHVFIHLYTYSGIWMDGGQDTIPVFKELTDVRQR